MENFGYVLASKMLVENHEKVGRAYREKVNNPDDSGWRFLCGKETQEYVNDAENVGIYDINTILRLDMSIMPYLDSAPGTFLERGDGEDAGKFVVYTDDEIERRCEEIRKGAEEK